MTHDKARKRATRALAAGSNLKYTTAHRLITHAEASATEPRRPFVLTIASPKGGTGRTTLAVNLAVAAARRVSEQTPTGSRDLPRVLLIDTAVQQADVGTHLGRHTPTVEDLEIAGCWRPSAGHASTDALLACLAVDENLGIAALLGPTDRRHGSPLLFTGRAYQRFLETVGHLFDYVIIDTPVAELYHDIFISFALPCAARVAAVVDQQRGSAANANAWLDNLVSDHANDGMGLERESVGVILNRVDPRAAALVATGEPYPQPQEVSSWPLLGAISASPAFAAAEQTGGVAIDMGDRFLEAELQRVWDTLLS